MLNRDFNQYKQLAHTLLSVRSFLKTWGTWRKNFMKDTKVITTPVSGSTGVAVTSSKELDDLYRITVGHSTVTSTGGSTPSGTVTYGPRTPPVGLPSSFIYPTIKAAPDVHSLIIELTEAINTLARNQEILIQKIESLEVSMYAPPGN